METGLGPLSFSVVVCSHNPENFTNLEKTLDSLLKQSYEIKDIVVVIDANQALADRVSASYSWAQNLNIVVTTNSLSSAQARNEGIKVSRGDVVAFIDDDAIADKDWVLKLARSYFNDGALAVGGNILPIWCSSKPEHLPEELYWLVGVTHRGFAEDGVREVRDTFGPNMSFRRRVFDEVGGFHENLGFAQGRSCLLQGEEAELCLRMEGKLGQRLVYNPEAVVYHCVPESKLGIGVLAKRSYYQGYSKALLRRLAVVKRPLATEQTYLKNVMLKYFPEHARKLFMGSRRWFEAKQLVVLLLCVCAVGLGFIGGYLTLTRRVYEQKSRG